MKKAILHFLRSKKHQNSELNIQTEKIFEELEIPQRTQIPPSEELIEKLNQIASKPPFCYTNKIKDSDPR